MHTGMLWFLTNKTLTLDQKIRQAVDYFHKKYGRMPDMCLVNPSLIDPKAPIEIKDLMVRPYQYVLPDHIWIGVEDKPSSKTAGDD